MPPRRRGLPHVRHPSVDPAFTAIGTVGPTLATSAREDAGDRFTRTAYVAGTGSDPGMALDDLLCYVRAERGAVDLGPHALPITTSGTFSVSSGAWTMGSGHLRATLPALDVADDLFIWAVVSTVAEPASRAVLCELGDAAAHAQGGHLWVGRDGSGAATPGWCALTGSGSVGARAGVHDGLHLICVSHHVAGRSIAVDGEGVHWVRPFNAGLDQNPLLTIGGDPAGTRRMVGSLYEFGIARRAPSDRAMRTLLERLAAKYPSLTLSQPDRSGVSASPVSILQHPYAGSTAWWTYPQAAEGDTTADVDDLITVRDGATLDTMRAGLISDMALSSAPPDAITIDYDDSALTHRWTGDVSCVYAQLTRIDRLDFNMPYGYSHPAYVLHPATPNGRLALYHHGHGDSIGYPAAFDARMTHAWLLREGYTVIACSMPLGAGGSQTDGDYPGLTTIGHAQLRTLDNHYRAGSAAFSPIRLLIEPAYRALLHLAPSYSHTCVLGLSGGGWSAALLAALTPLAQRSYPIMGTLPMFVRMGITKYLGDSEQGETLSLYNRARHIDQYVLGASGPNRRQICIYNPQDTAIFDINADTWSSHVQAAVDAVGRGGSYRVAFDQTHPEHAVSPSAISTILEDQESV